MRTNLLLQFKLWLHSELTDPSIIEFLLSGLQSWFRHPTSTSTTFSSDPYLQSAFLSQSQLGWLATLCGFLSTPLVDAQAEYYSLIESRRSSVKWGSKLIKQLWNIAFQLWSHRNNVLHKTEALQKLSGLPLLKTCIQREYLTGPSDLSPVYNHYFTTPLPTLLNKRPAYLRRWFLVIRSARESLQIFPDDEFSVDNTLRNWIHLPPR